MSGSRAGVGALSGASLQQPPGGPEHRAELLALTAGPVRVEATPFRSDPSLRALCRRCRWVGPTRCFSRSLSDDALARHEQALLVADVREHRCDERVVALAALIDQGPDVMADGLEAVIAAVLAAQAALAPPALHDTCCQPQHAIDQPEGDAP